ncbi:putative protein-like [Forsythia ovata]|uniref:DUF7054 domain-containing protein n=1 Tax=Forsythia ovata TaxID=205694 RepID=A0ABD1U6C8_9LAMI
MLPRPRTVPELLVRKKTDVMSSIELGMAHGRPKLTKLLLHVTIQRSLGAVYVLMSPDATVDDLIMVALRQYAKEGQATDHLLCAIHLASISIIPKTLPSAAGCGDRIDGVKVERERDGCAKAVKRNAELEAREAQLNSEVQRAREQETMAAALQSQL